MTITPAIIITYPFPLGVFNGGARSIREVALRIGRRGIPVYLIAVSNKKGSNYPRQPVEQEFQGHELDAEFEAANVQVIRVVPHKVDPYLDGLEVRRIVRQLMAERPIGAVIGCYHEAVFLPKMLKGQNIPFAIFAIWQSYEAALKLPSKFRYPVRYVTNVYKRRLLMKMYRQADHHFAISDHTGRELEQFMGIDGRKITTTYLGVADKFFQIERPQPEKIRRFFFFGRIIKMKGAHDAIEAFRRLKERGYHDWEFYFNGQGRIDWAKSLIRKAGLEEQIFIIDPSNDSDLLNDLWQSDLVILPSYGESFGLSFAEAQASALPVLGYEVGSVPEVVAHGETGWLAPLGDIEKLTDYLVWAIEKPEAAHSMGLAGRERIRESFSWEHTADTILNGLNNLGSDLK